MSRNFFAAIVVVSLLLIQSTASADYPKYLNGDRNYIMFDGHLGDGRYIVRNSLRVEADNYPYLRLSIDWVVVPRAYYGSTEIVGGRQSFHLAYDRNARKIYHVNPQTGDEHYLPRNVSRTGGSSAMYAAEMAFYLVTGEKFYGFSDEFYPDR